VLNNMFIIFVLVLVLFPHAFVEYRSNTYVILSHETLSELLIETIERVYSNDTFAYNLTVFVLNFSEIFPYTINFDNLTCPRQFFFISNPGRGVIPRSIPLILVNKSNNYFVYYGKSYIGYDEFDWYYYVNSTGVPYKIILIQKDQYGQVVSITIYTLISSNIININEKPIVPKGFKLINETIVQRDFSENLNSALDFSLGGYIVLFNLILVPVLVAVKLYVSRHKKVN